MPGNIKLALNRKMMLDLFICLNSFILVLVFNILFMHLCYFDIFFYSFPALNIYYFALFYRLSFFILLFY